MAAGAARRGRLVVDLGLVAGQAARAVILRNAFVREMAARARGVTRHAVEARPRRGRVTAGAGRRLRDAVGSVGPMAARAVHMLAVTGRCLVRVTARAGRGGSDLAAVWIVARRAGLVSLRGTRRLGGVAARARGRRLLRLVCTSGVTAEARTVARVDLRRDRPMADRTRGGRSRRHVSGLRMAALARTVARRADATHLLRVALRAERDGQRGLTGMRRVAIEALRGRVMRLGMTALAGDGDLPRRERMRGVTPDARARMLDLLRVARGARPWSRGLVRIVAGRARRMLRRREHGLGRMTARAWSRFVGAERVWRVAARAPGMTGGQRRDRDLAGLGGLLGMTAGARGVRDQRGLVHRVAIEAAARPRVLGLLLLMTRRTGLDVERGRRVRAVTVAAGLVRVRTDGRHMKALGLLVAAHAARRTNRQVRAKPVTVLTRGNRDEPDRIRRMKWGLHGTVTALADLGGRRREPRVAVTVATRHLVLLDVHGVTRARPDVLPALRHRARWCAIPAARDPEHGDQHADRDARDGDRPWLHRAPIGWHSRHGIALSG
ncbi:MAG: hypothetical protein JWP01_99 [Myxococcales bacterium]|nr:hypothetical protein [Myxococcales bacterium]